ncbi:MAG TPA: hypothetical protein VF077_13210 [Nitrospiraceae bacterium]
MTGPAEMDDARRSADDEEACSIEERANELAETGARLIIADPQNLYDWVTLADHDWWPQLSRALVLAGYPDNNDVDREAAGYLLKHIHGQLLAAIQKELLTKCLREARQEHQAAQNRRRYRSEEE